jgi:DNA-binding MarR family transcriptional regulator
MEWRPDPDRHLSLLFDVFALGQRTRTLVALAMSGCELRPDEYAAYSVVFETPKITMTALARELGAPVTTAADYVRAMQRRGHVRREGHPTDSRSYVLTLTAAGRRAHRAASTAFQRAHRALATALAPTREADARAGLAELIEATDRAIATLTPAPKRRAPANP